MAQTIKLKRSSVSGNTPGTSDLELGEVAINTYDGKMFIKKNDGSDSIVEIGGTSGTVTEAFKTIAVSGQSSVVADSATDTLTFVAGSNMTITTNASGDTITFASSGGGGTQNVFSTFAVSGQSSVVADSTTDTLTLAAGSGINITTNASTDTITIAATASAITVQDEGSALSTSATTLNFVGAGVTATGTGATKTITIPGTGTVSEAFKTIAVSGQSNVVADGATDTLTLAAGSGMTITTNASNDTITFASSGGGSQNVFSNIGVSGQGTIQADSTTDTLTFEAGTGISLATDTTNDKLTITATGGTSNVANAASSIKEFKYDISSSTTTITGSDANSNTLAYEAGAIQVFLNGILLDPATDYTASNGTSVVLTDAAVSGDDVQIVSFNRKIVTANVGLSTFTGDGSTTAFTLSSDPVHENNTRVHIDGVYQEKAAYSVSGTTLTFSGAPPNGSSIEVEIGFTQAEIGSTLDFADNAILRIGTGNDLQILHDGSDSIIKDTGTGDLKIAASRIQFTNAAINENIIDAVADGAVTLYHDNNAKLATATGGVTITGTATATTFSGDLSGTINTATTGTTQSASDNSTKIATTAYVDTAVTNLVDSAPGTLNTLNELAAALGDDANFSTTITNSLATKVGLTATTGAANIPAGTTGQRPGSPAAGQFRYNSTLNQFEGYTSSWGAIGGGGTNTFTTDVFTSSGSAAFTLTQAVASPNDCIVHIDGIYQTPTDAYTVSGTTLTFTSTPASGRKIVVYSVKAGVSGNNLNIQTFSGNGSTTSFTMNINPINENNTIVHIDGVYQQKTSYSTSGTTISFSAAPANGTTIEVATFTQTEINVPVNDTIDTVHIKDDAVTSAKLGGNLVAPGTVTASAGFVGPLTGNVTGTIQTAAQTNITSVGTLTGLALSGNITTGGITINGASSVISDSSDLGIVSGGDLTIDVTGNIILDADGGDVKFLDGGTEGLRYSYSGAGPQFFSPVADKDIVFKGNDSDGGGTITALTLDMSEAGYATFNNFIKVNDRVVGNSNLILNTHDSNEKIHLDASGFIKFETAGSERMRIDSGGNVGIGETSPSAKFHIKKTAASTQHYDQFATAIVEDTEARLQIVASEGGSNAAGLLLTNEAKHWGVVHHGTGNSNIFSIGYYASSSSGLDLSDNLSDILNITTGGNVGIGDNNPGDKLVVKGDGARIVVSSADMEVAMLGRRGSSGTALDSGYLRLRDQGVTANGVVLDTNGSSWLNGGNVGIGTASPSRLLTVQSTGQADLTIRSGDSSYSQLMFGDTSADNRGGVLYNNSTDDLHLATTITSGAGIGLTVDSSQNVGVGTTNPYYQLDVFGANLSNGAAKNLALFFDTTSATAGTGGGIAFGGYSNGTSGNINHLGNIQGIKENSTAGNYASAMVFSTRANGAAPVEQMRISSSGSVTTNPSGGVITLGANGHITSKQSLDVITAGGRYMGSSNRGLLGQMRIEQKAQGADGGYIALDTSAVGSTSPTERMRIDSDGAVIVNNAGGDAQIYLGGTSGADRMYLARSGNDALLWNVDAGVMRFATYNSEVMRMLTDGQLCLNTQAQIAAGYIMNVECASGTGGIIIKNSGANNVPLSFRNTSGNSIGAVTTTESATTYLTSSDQRLKDNIQDAADAGELIDAVQVRQFDWKADGKHQRYGMVAQELNTVAPEAVYTPEDPEEMMGVDYSKLVPMLIKEIQSLRSRVAELENK